MVNMFLLSILFTYIFIRGLSATVSCCLLICSQQSWISDTEHDPSGNLNLLFYVGADVLN